VVGHSMGGKAAMVLALQSPQSLRHLLVGDIAPVTYEHNPNSNISAMKSLNFALIKNRADADVQLAKVMDDAPLRAFLLQSLNFKADPVGWRINLLVLEKYMPNIVGWPTIMGEFSGPVLFLSGGLSHYVKPEYRSVIRRLFPQARFAKIPNVGHWLHAENPRSFEDTLRIFLDT
jgi:esterase